MNRVTLTVGVLSGFKQREQTEFIVSDDCPDCSSFTVSFLRVSSEFCRVLIEKIQRIRNFSAKHKDFNMLSSMRLDELGASTALQVLWGIATSGI
jgi:hypothetical protein